LTYLDGGDRPPPDHALHDADAVVLRERAAHLLVLLDGGAAIADVVHLQALKASAGLVANGGARVASRGALGKTVALVQRCERRCSSCWRRGSSCWRRGYVCSLKLALFLWLSLRSCRRAARQGDGRFLRSLSSLSLTPDALVPLAGRRGPWFSARRPPRR
jgi:hypothetical protein